MIAYATDVEALGTTALRWARSSPHPAGQRPGQHRTSLAAVPRLHGGRSGPWAGGRPSAVAATMFVRRAKLFRGGARPGPRPRARLGRAAATGLLGERRNSRGAPASAAWRPDSCPSGRLGLRRRRQHPTRLTPWAILGGDLLLAAPVWWYAMRTPRFLPLHSCRPRRSAGWSVGEAFYFFLTPVLLGWAIHQVAPAWFDARAGLVALLVAIPISWPATHRVRPVFALGLGQPPWERRHGNIGMGWSGSGPCSPLPCCGPHSTIGSSETMAAGTPWRLYGPRWTSSLPVPCFSARPPMRPSWDPGPGAVGYDSCRSALAAGLWRSVAVSGTAPLVRGGSGS